jgi:penicillin-binding protein 2
MLSIISKGMIDVVHGSKGTARATGIGLPYIIAGKTGTSQLISITDHDEKDRINIPDNLVDHALFVAFAPADNPRIVIAIVVENGGSGSKVAAPIAKKIFDYYFIDRLLRASATWKEFGFG